MIESHLCKHPDAAADTLHADGFALEILRRANLRRCDEITVKLIDQAGNKNQIQASSHRPERRAGSRHDIRTAPHWQPEPRSPPDRCAPG